MVTPLLAAPCLGWPSIFDLPEDVMCRDILDGQNVLFWRSVLSFMWFAVPTTWDRFMGD